MDKIHKPIPIQDTLQHQSNNQTQFWQFGKRFLQSPNAGARKGYAALNVLCFTLSKHGICVFHVTSPLNMYYFPTHHNKPITGLFKGGAVCLLRC
jgi:hypothetical protein